MTVLLCEFCQPRLLLLHFELRYRQMFLGAAAFASLHIVIPCLSHGGEEIILQNGIGFSEHSFPVCVQQRFPMLVQRGLGIPLFTHTDLLYRFLERTHQRFILAAFRPQDLLFHDGNVHHMKVIVVHVLPQRVGHGAVALVGVHDRRENVLLSAYDFYCGFVCVGVELFCEVIAAVIMKIGGVYVKDQLAVEKGIRFQTAC